MIKGAEAFLANKGNCPLAIVGIGCRFPGSADDVNSFWKMLVEGRSGIMEVPKDRWDLGRHYHPDPSIPDMVISNRGGFIDILDKFDARFWGLSPREAKRMDPQQRWLLEVAWEALEDAGTAPQHLRGKKVGVFVGIASNDYAWLQMPYHEEANAYTNSGNTASIASNRISYLLDLRGPSASVDTACSSGLVATWLACRSIWSGNCTAALAGGVNALITPHASIGFSRAGMLSPSGQCFAFDARANGYVRAEGAGMVYVKTLDQALADRDRIYAIIRAAVVNQDGHTSSMTVPGVEGQAAMLRQAYQEAGLSPGCVVYMEAHGTGTPVGDPIEVTAIGQVLREGRQPGSRCLIGSVKTNIGHLEAGSGLAGLIKAALVLHKDAVPPCCNFQTPNPHIPFNAFALEVAARFQPLPHLHGLPPIVGVNSFGFGGTNAHVVLEAAPPVAAQVSVSVDLAIRPHLLPISARDEVSLRNYVESYRDFLADPTLNLADVCYSAGARKEHHNHRLLVLGNDAEALRGSLETWLRGNNTVERLISGAGVQTPLPLTFIFTGQGGQWWAMGRQLLEREPIFRRTVQRIDALLQPLAGFSLIEEMTRDEQDTRIDRTDVAQPTIFAVQVGLSQLWQSWGIQPARVVGHSVGEVAATWCAGIYSLEDAVKIIYHRSRLQNKTGGHGRMLAAGISAREARKLIGDLAQRVKIAVLNSPTMVTLAGDTEPLEDIAWRMRDAGQFHRWLRIDYAFHTHQMEPIRDELLEVLADIRPRPSQVPFTSTVTGGLLDGEQLDNLYWWRNVRQPVLFGPAIANLVSQGESTFLELGPHPALSSSINEIAAAQAHSGGVFHSLRRNTDESVELLTNLAGLALQGQPIDWAAVNQSGGEFVALPRYPWNRESFWLESKSSARDRLAPVEHPLLGLRVAAAQPTWQFSLHPGKYGYLNDHCFWDSIVFPGAGYGEIGLGLARALFPTEPHAVEDLEIKKALFINPDQPPTVQVVFNPEDKTFVVCSSLAASDDWELHAQGRLTRVAPVETAQVDLARLREALTDHFDHDRYYAEFAAAGYQFGPNFQHLQNVWRTQGEALAEIVVPEPVLKTVEQYHFHPAVLDACFHIFRGVQVVPPDALPKDSFYLPQAIRRIRLECDKPPAHLWAHARLVTDDGHSLVSDIHVYDDQGRQVAEILGFRADHVEQKQSADDVDNCYYQFSWDHCRLPGRGAETPESLAATGYVVFADRSGVADRLIALLRGRGSPVVRVLPGTEFRRTDLSEFATAVDSAEDMQRLMREAAGAMGGLAGVVHCWSLDHPAPTGLDTRQLSAAQLTGVLSALCLVQAGSALPPQAWFVTRNVHHVQDGDPADGLASSPLVGLLRVANNELPGCRLTMVDFDAAPADELSADLLHEMIAGDGESEVVYRDSRRSALRLQRVRAEALPVRTRNAVGPDGLLVPYRLETNKPGILDNLTLNETRRREPGPGEIEIRVRAGGVNFRDVMKALGTYPGNPSDVLWFGDDVAGVVERVGADVRHLAPGDEVLGMAPYAFRAFVTVDARMVFRKPRHLSFEQAATVPTVFLTAHYALRHLARMQPGEKVLIHAGAGGVGQAAIQIAKRLGLEIFATAGSEEKRRLLRELGAHHVMNSRTLEFADQIQAITGGRGVDAVLNSLAGDFIPKSMSVLAPFGRFLEIGKIDIYKNSKIGLEPLRNNISYFVIDMAQHLMHKPDYAAQLFVELGELFANGEYQALPYSVFPITKVVDAFRYMAQGKHIGKNVLSFEADAIPIGPCTEDDHRFRPDATYLITGGAGGFGWELAKWMVRRGARHLVLSSRSGPREEASRDIEQLRAAGITVVDARCDVTNWDAVTRLVRQIRDELPPLKGIIHGAMVLDDEFLTTLDEVRFRKALDPKMLGAWNLHAATQDLDLDHFIGFSSFSSVIGGPKQSNYNAGNFFLEALAQYRHARGLPAATIAWGALVGAGFVERNQKTAQYLDKVGMKAFNIEEALRVFGRLMQLDPVQITASRVDWRALSKASPAVANGKTYAALTQESGDAEGGGSIVGRLLAVSPDARPRIVEDFLVSQLAGVFGADETNLDRNAPLTSLGLDSLMAVELANRIERELGMGIPLGSLLNGPSLVALAQIVVQLLAPQLAGDAESEAKDLLSSGAAPLEKVEIPHDEFPLCEEQQTVWRRAQQAPGSSVCHLVFAAKFAPSLDVVALKQAFASIQKRHPMLNIVLRESQGRIIQRIEKNVGMDFGEFDVCTKAKNQVPEVLIQEAYRSFDLDHGPLVRMRVIRTHYHEQYVVLAIHQIIADSPSVSILLQDLLQAYSAILAERTWESHPHVYRFEDFVAWERKQLDGAAGTRILEFWKHELQDAPLQLNLPTDHPRPKAASLKGADLGFTLDDQLSHQALALSAEQDVSLFITLLVAFEILLHRECLQPDLLVGTSLAARPQRELQPLVGCFANFVPIRSRIDDDPTCADLLKRVGQQISAARDNPQFPLSRLIEQLQVRPDASRPPLVQVAFLMERPCQDRHGISACLLGHGGHRFHWGEIAVEAVDCPAPDTSYEITLAVEEAGGRIHGCWRYNPDLFAEDTIERLHAGFCAMLTQIASDPLQRASQIEIAERPHMRHSTECSGVLDWRGTDAVSSAAAIDYDQEAQLDPDIVPPEGSVCDPSFQGAGLPKREQELNDAVFWKRVTEAGGGIDVDEYLHQKTGTRLLNRAFWGFIRLMLGGYITVKVEGEDRLPKPPFILISNHNSHLDTLSLYHALGKDRQRSLAVLAAQDYFFKNKIMGYFFKSVLNTIPVGRSGDFSDGLNCARQLVDRGRIVLIFPEGTRSVTGALQPFKPGIGLLVSMLDVPIIPVKLIGPYELWPKGQSTPKRGTVTVRFGSSYAVPSNVAGKKVDYARFQRIAKDLHKVVTAT